MSKTTWTDERLTTLFNRYNRKFWSGKLPAYTVTTDISARTAGENWLGLCESEKRLIHIDLNAHKDDSAVRATLLHEMAHAADSRGKYTPGDLVHGYGFWRELEKLLAKGAPVSITNSEAPHIALHAAAIPAHLKLCRKAVEREDQKRQKAFDNEKRRASATGGSVTVTVMTDEMLVSEFEDAAWELTWRQAYLLVGGEYGLLDVGGKPKNKWAGDIIVKGKKAHARTRRRLLKAKGLEEQLRASGYADAL